MGCFMPNNGKGTQANKLESDKILEKYINAYDGNKTSWALFVFKETGLRSPSAWRKVLERYVQMTPALDPKQHMDIFIIKIYQQHHTFQIQMVHRVK